MSLLRFCQWLAATRGSMALHESLFMYPLIESVHVLTLSIFVGLSVMFDLRLLGVSMRRVPVSEMAERLIPWMAAGFGIMVISGALLFYAIPVRSFQNVFFRFKLLMLLLAGINAWLFHARVYRRVNDWDVAAVTPRAARFAGAASLLLWALIVIAGRLIAYNWFDCDLPQRAIIVSLAGCVVGSP